MKENTEPSTGSTDRKKPLIGIPEVKEAASFLLGAWALKKFPKMTVMGLVGIGVLVGMGLKQVVKKVDSTQRSPDELH